MAAIVLAEWKHKLVAGELDTAGRIVAERLNKTRRLRVQELRSGVRIEALSYVGHVALGSLRVTIRPKISGLPLQRLLRYAYGLRDLELHDPVEQSTTEDALLDVLLHQFVAEVEEILARGLHRVYQRRAELLASPRGRIDFQHYAMGEGAMQAALPCVHHPRQEDGVLNQALLGGLRAAVELAEDGDLRLRLLRLAARLDGVVSRVRLGPKLLERAWRAMDRRTESYGAALRLVELLCLSRGPALSDGQERLPGFLFDMNRFFQRLLGRFLRENLPLAQPDAEVVEEHRLSGMMRYAPQHNPQGRRAPTPRPDFAVRREGQIVMLLDAKYRDLWERSLPREMLYQLAMYALSQQTGRTAAILYPTLGPAAREARIQIRDPVRESERAVVVLRPVNLLALDQALQATGTDGDRVRAALAGELAMGDALS